MSKTSRSYQSAEGNSPTIEGTSSSSRTSALTRMRWFRCIDRKW